MADTFVQQVTRLQEERKQKCNARRLQASLSPLKGPRFPNLSLERFRASTKYSDRPAAADIAFCVAAYANGMNEARLNVPLKTTISLTIPALPDERPTSVEP